MGLSYVDNNEFVSVPEKNPSIKYFFYGGEVLWTDQ